MVQGRSINQIDTATVSLHHIVVSRNIASVKVPPTLPPKGNLNLFCPEVGGVIKILNRKKVQGTYLFETQGSPTKRTPLPQICLLFSFTLQNTSGIYGW